MSLSRPVPLALDRFKRLAQRSSQVWQGGLFRLPMWIGDESGPVVEPYRPVGAAAPIRTAIKAARARRTKGTRRKPR